MAGLSTHVLDAVTGTPAAGVAVTVTGPDGSVVGHGTTDADGRVGELAGALAAGTHRITFDTGRWFVARGVEAFWPEVTLAFTVADPGARLHVPLLLSPFAYSTYRGS